MANLTAYINKDTLKAICKAKGVDVSYVADKINCKPPTKINDWIDNNSDIFPTLNQAKEIAKCLNVPFAGLYMNPQSLKIKPLPQLTNRRTFPDGYTSNDCTLNIAISDLILYRDFLLETQKELKETFHKFDLSINTNADVIEFSTAIRTFFNIYLNEQFNLPSKRKFYLYIRKQVEAKGVFIHCFSGVPLETIRGIAIYDNTVPIIGINQNDRYPAMTFSIIHELVHLIKRQSSLCNESFDRISLSNEEIFCNAVAGEVLVPTEALNIKIKNKSKDVFTLDDIDDFSNSFCVSKEVIIRRLLDMRYISKIAYDTYNNEIKEQLEKDKENQKSNQEKAKLEGRDSGFRLDPVRIAIDKTSSSLTNVLLKGYREQLFSKQDISRYIGIKPKNVDRFLQEVSK
jgi:Zn-dependent peptidase ImmA (M78 family)